MNTKVRPLCTAAILLLLASACANQADTPSMAENADRVCINVNRISGFNSLSDHELLVTVGVNELYLLTVDAYCPGLRHAYSIAVVDTVSRICNDGFGRVVFKDQSFGPQSCSVSNIEPVMSSEEAKEIVAARRDARRNK